MFSIQIDQDLVSLRHDGQILATGFDLTLFPENGPPIRQPLTLALPAIPIGSDHPATQPLPEKGQALPLQQKWQETVLYGDQPLAQSSLTLMCQPDRFAIRVKAQIPPVRPYFGRQSHFRMQESLTLNLGLYLDTRILAIYQHKNWWLRPAFCPEAADVPDRTQLLLCKTGQNYLVMLALSGRQGRSDLHGTPDGLALSFSLNAINQDICEDVLLVAAIGPDPYACCELAVRTGFEATGKSDDLRRDLPFPETFSRLGWCSWDAFYHQVSEQGILDKLAEFTGKALPVGWLVIDDGWSDADMTHQQLQSLDAAPGKFPDGLAAAIQRIRAAGFSGKIGVWQASMGYWNGISPGSEADRLLSPYLITLPDGRRVPRLDTSAVFGFWHTWHRYLKQCGVDFIKLDGQSAIALVYEGILPYAQASQIYHAGLDASLAVHFGDGNIHCMGMAPQDFWNRTSASLSRSSDDFVPDNPATPHGFREHALQNAYNSLLHSQRYWGDWDMFWSEHHEQEQNAILRAMSGGPVYISDAVGKTSAEAIRPLILDDGRVLRCDAVGLPTLDCLLENPLTSQSPLKLFNPCGQSVAVAAFQINSDGLSGMGSIGIDDIPGLTGQDVWIYDWKEQTVYRLAAGQRLAFAAPADSVRLMFLLPCHDTPGLLGLIDKYMAPATIIWQKRQTDSLVILLAQGGTFAWISEQAPLRVTLDGCDVIWQSQGPLHRIDCRQSAQPLIQIMLEPSL